MGLIVAGDHLLVSLQNLAKSCWSKQPMSGERFNELGRFEAFKNRCWAHPVLAGPILLCKAIGKLCLLLAVVGQVRSVNCLHH